MSNLLNSYIVYINAYSGMFSCELAEAASEHGLDTTRFQGGVFGHMLGRTTYELVKQFEKNANLNGFTLHATSGTNVATKVKHTDCTGDVDDDDEDEDEDEDDVDDDEDGDDEDGDDDDVQGHQYEYDENVQKVMLRSLRDGLRGGGAGAGGAGAGAGGTVPSQAGKRKATATEKGKAKETKYDTRCGASSSGAAKEAPLTQALRKRRKGDHVKIPRANIYETLEELKNTQGFKVTGAGSVSGVISEISENSNGETLYLVTIPGTIDGEEGQCEHELWLDEEDFE